MRPLAVLRPEPAASATVRRAEAMGLQAYAMPLFRTEPLRWQPPATENFDALLLTSANAVRHAGAELAHFGSLPVYAVGDATAAVARDAGFAVAAVGLEGIDALLTVVPKTLRLLHLCGEDRVLPRVQRKVTAIPVYRSVAVDHPAGLDQLSGSVALVHSPRAGRRLAELVSQRGATAIVAISAAAAEGCSTGWQAIAVAGRPREEAMLSLAARLCEQVGSE